MHSAVRACLAEFRAKARELREVFGDDGRARALEWAAAQVETALHSEADRLVFLPEAATISGYCAGHLARMVRKGQIPDRRPPGSRGHLKVRVSDLPTKPGYKHTPPSGTRSGTSTIRPASATATASAPYAM